MIFTVIEVIDGDTFRVSPSWSWNNQTGDTVRAVGYNTPELGQSGYIVAKNTLVRLILNKTVVLKNAVTISYGRLVCDVYSNGKNLASFFPAYQT